MRANFAKRPSHLLTSNSKVQRKLQLFLTQDVYKDQGDSPSVCQRMANTWFANTPMGMRFGDASVFESNTPLLHPPRRLAQHGQLRLLHGFIPNSEQRAIA
jgi:hypothetical protein